MFIKAGARHLGFEMFESIIPCECWIHLIYLLSASTKRIFLETAIGEKRAILKALFPTHLFGKAVIFIPPKSHPGRMLSAGMSASWSAAMSAVVGGNVGTDADMQPVVKKENSKILELRKPVMVASNFQGLVGVPEAGDRPYTSQSRNAKAWLLTGLSFLHFVAQIDFPLLHNRDH